MLSKASQNSPGCSSASSFPTSRDRAVLDGWSLSVCACVLCFEKAWIKAGSHSTLPPPPTQPLVLRAGVWPIHTIATSLFV